MNTINPDLEIEGVHFFVIHQRLMPGVIGRVRDQIDGWCYGAQRSKRLDVRNAVTFIGPDVENYVGFEHLGMSDMDPIVANVDEFELRTLGWLVGDRIPGRYVVVDIVGRGGNKKSFQLYNSDRSVMTWLYGVRSAFSYMGTASSGLSM